MGDFVSLLIYIISFGTSVFLIYSATLYRSYDRDKYRLYTILGLLVPIIFAAIRYKVGTDFASYVAMFNRLSNTSIVDYFQNMNVEWGYYVLQRVTGIFGDYKVMFFFASSITIIFVYLTILEHKLSISIPLSFLIYLFVFFPSSFNIIRQHMAISLGVFSFNYIFKKDLKMFLVLVFLAVSFHFTAIIILPFYFIINGKIKLPKNIVLEKKQLMIITVIIALLVSLNYQLIIKLISQIGPLEKFASYAIADSRSLNREVYLNILILLPILYFRKELIEHDKRNEIYIFFLLISLCFTLTGFSSPIVKRIGMYFGIVEIFLIPSLPEVIQNKYGKYFANLLIIGYAVFYFILVFYILGQTHIIPYQIQ